MSSFDYELKDHLRRAGAPVIDEPDQDIEAALEAMQAKHRTAVYRLMGWSMAYGFEFGILATLAVQHIFGAA